MDARSTYQRLLGLYPRDYRELFRAEMLAVFDQRAEESQREGWAAWAQFALAEWTGVIWGAAREWQKKLGGRKVKQETADAPDVSGLPDEVAQAERQVRRVLGAMEDRASPIRKSAVLFVCRAEGAREAHESQTQIPPRRIAGGRGGATGIA